MPHALSMGQLPEAMVGWQVIAMVQLLGGCIPMLADRVAGLWCMPVCRCASIPRSPSTVRTARMNPPHV